MTAESDTVLGNKEVHEPNRWNVSTRQEVFQCLL
jgi:hypothetical protein